MTKQIRLLAATAILWGNALTCRADASFMEKELQAKFPADLGPATVDVSKYPAYQQQNYELFQHACSMCHTLARPINSALIAQEDWARYVRRMHLRAKGQLLSKEDFKRVVDFLAYDSERRKVENQKAFHEIQRQLSRRFQEVKTEQERLLNTKKQKTKEPAPYTGTP